MIADYKSGEHHEGGKDHPCGPGPGNPLNGAPPPMPTDMEAQGNKHPGPPPFGGDSGLTGPSGATSSDIAAASQTEAADASGTESSGYDAGSITDAAGSTVDVAGSTTDAAATSQTTATG